MWAAAAESGLATGATITFLDNAARYFAGANSIGDSVHRQRGQHRLQQHGLRAVEYECGDQPGVHLDGRAGEEQYFLDRGVRQRGRVVRNRHRVRLQRLFFGVGNAVQLGRHGVHVCELEDEQRAGCAFAEFRIRSS